MTEIITFTLPNGEIVDAPAGMWIAAFIEQLSDFQRANLIARVAQIKREHIAKTSIPGGGVSPVPIIGRQPVQGKVVHTDFTVDENGKKHYRMMCEPGVINSSLLKGKS